MGSRHHAGEHPRDDLQSAMVHEVGPAAGFVHEPPQSAAARSIALQGQDVVALRGRSFHLARAGRQPPRSEEPVAGDVGYAGDAADFTRAVPSVPRGCEGQGCGREPTAQGNLRRDADASRGPADHRDRLVPVLPGPRIEVGHPVSAGENVDLNGQPFSLQRPGVTSVWINVFITWQTAFALHVCASRRRSHDVLGVRRRVPS